MEKYVLALDQGTTSSRAILFDKKGNVKAICQQEFTQFFPKTGWVEHDANEIWETQLNVAKQVLKENNINASEIDSIGITNQRETTILWNKKTGKPVYNAIVWQDKRTIDFCEDLKAQGLESYVKQNTGLVIDAYFSGTKINWILNNVEEAKQLCEDKNLAFGTVDSWLIYNLTNGKVHCTDFSNASRTMLFNIKKLDWDEKLLDALQIPKHILPTVKSSSEIVGSTDETIFGEEIKIAGIAGDQQAALFGQQCFKKGMAKNTYGTGCFMLMQTEEDFVVSKNGLLTTIAWKINGKVSYALEGSIFIAGAAIQWLRDELKLIDESPDSEYFGLKVEDTNGVYFVPAFSGLGAPYWNMNAKGAIFGLTRGSSKAHLIRATLESLAYQTKDVLEAMQQDANLKLNSLKVDGGASNNNLLMQFQADILNCKVARPKVTETTAFGAALLAGLATGFYNLEKLKLNAESTTLFNPKMEEEKRNTLYDGWKDAVRKTIA